jgi:uncharacterized protein (DUF488 family)
MALAEVTAPARATLATIGYEAATVQSFMDALTEARVDVLVDVRAIASSRRPGFAKSALSANLAAAGIEYLHLRGLGTPADGRAAARAGRHEEMHRIFAAHLETPVARADLDVLVGMLRDGRRACIMCLEARPEHCHRSLVADVVARRTPVRVEHLFPGGRDAD